MAPMRAPETEPDREGGSTEVGLRIRALRLQRRMSQARLAQRSGVPQYQISRIERGVREIRPSALAAIANALDVTVDELLKDLTEALRGPKPAA
jgi:transcriptional regulator with XRE-family HTH domain